MLKSTADTCPASTVALSTVHSRAAVDTKYIHPSRKEKTMKLQFGSASSCQKKWLRMGFEPLSDI